MSIFFKFLRINLLSALMVVSCLSTAQLTLNFSVSQPSIANAKFGWQFQGNDMLKVQFTDSSTADIIQRKWIFGDGDSVVGNSISQFHTYARGGLYEACLLVTNINGCTDLYCEDISSYTGFSGFSFDQNSITISPNPFKETTTVGYYLKEPSVVSLEVYNMVGSKVKTLVNGVRQAGQQSIAITGLSASHNKGIYLLKLSIGGKSYVKKLIEVN